MIRTFLRIKQQTSFLVTKIVSFLREQTVTFVREKTTVSFTFSVYDVIISAEGIGVTQPEATIFELESGNFLLFANGNGVLLLED